MFASQGDICGDGFVYVTFSDRSEKTKKWKQVALESVQYDFTSNGDPLVGHFTALMT
jgi:hypothetical protein